MNGSELRAKGAGIVPGFHAPYAPADEAIADRLLTAAPAGPAAEARIDKR